MKKQRLFDDQAEEELGDINVNEEYAQRFEHNKRREELHRLQEKHPEVAARLAKKAALEAAKQSRVAAAAGGGDDQLLSEDLSESSSEDDDEDLDLEEDDTDKVLETLVRIKRHDPALYQQDTVICPQQQLSDDDGAGDAAEAADGVNRGSSKPVYLRTVLAQQALAAGDAADDDVDDDDGDIIPRAPVSSSYASEQAALKAAFLAAAQEVDEDTAAAAAAAGSEEVGGLVKKKKAAAAAAAQDGAPTTKGADTEQDVNKLLDEYFGPDDSSIDPADAFLKNYLANKAWKQPAAGTNSGSRKRFRDSGVDEDDDDDDDGSSDEDDAGDDDEDEEFLEEVDRFEAAYNFRYEEPGAAKIQSFPRVIADSVRRKDDRRKRAREAKAARVSEEKATREAELRRMKNLKKEEIQNMLSRIQQEAGLKTEDDHMDKDADDNDGGEDVNELLADLLEGDFDPEEYDRRMAAAFNDSYYQGSDDADELFADGEEELADEQDVELPAQQQQQDDDAQDQKAAAAGFAALRQKQKQQDQAAEAAQAAAAQRGQLQRLLEDYYKLDYEDMIGDVPCRFRYKQVDAESFGLSAEDVLSLSDKQLNSVVGLKLLAPYRDGHKKLRPNYKALQELKGEAAGLAARKLQQAEKKKKKKAQQQHSSKQEQVEQQPVNGVHKQQQGQQEQRQQQQQGKQQQQQQQQPRSQQQQHKKIHKGQQQQQKKSHKGQQQQCSAAAEITAEDKQAARLASYAKLSLKPTKEQQQQKRRPNDADGSSKHAKKKHKKDADGQQQPAGRLANVELAGPISKAQKKNLLRSLKRQEKHRQQPGQQ